MNEERERESEKVLIYHHDKKKDKINNEHFTFNYFQE